MSAQIIDRIQRDVDIAIKDLSSGDALEFVEELRSRLEDLAGAIAEDIRNRDSCSREE